MNKLNTTSVSLAVTPTVVSTLFSHYLNKKAFKEQPTARLSYDQGLHLVRAFLDFASHHTVEELQAFTAQWVPHPQWVKVEDVTVGEKHLTHAAELLIEQLGPQGIREVGGCKWWQWRRPDNPGIDAEWIEMREHAHERKKTGEPLTRVMMYIHGGAYFFGSVDEHRYQMQRHARKLRARLFAPRYRLSPQFPFPCGLQDCLAAYLYLLEKQDPSTIVLAGDSAGGGMVLSLLCVLRDQGIPLPAGAILISPWVDLTHSFPSVSGTAPLDYIPQAGFHHKPSQAWPPPNEDDINMLRREAEKKKNSSSKLPGTSQLKEKQQAPVVAKDDDTAVEPKPEIESNGTVSDPEKFLTVTIDGELVTVKDQIQMYTSNALLTHPLVSPVMQPTLGGLPPLLIIVGGGEFLRDEQIYVAHKCANPTRYAPAPEKMTEKGKMLLDKYKPTDVQLQVWDDLCHVATTLSFTRPAKYMYRSIAQFGAWALARAQCRGIEILDDDAISVISHSPSDSDDAAEDKHRPEPSADEQNGAHKGEENSKSQSEPPDNAKKQGQAPEPADHVGRAGDPLPKFQNHMIRQRVTRKGIIMPLATEAELPACCMAASEIGVIKEAPVKKWLETKRQWDTRYASTKAKVHRKIVEEMVAGYYDFGPGEKPPLSAMAGRRKIGSEMKTRKRSKSLGLALWSLWGSKHDEMTVEREAKADQPPETQQVHGEEQGARTFSDIEQQARPPLLSAHSRSPSRRMVVDENQTGSLVLDENTPVAKLLEQRREKESDLLSPSYSPQTGAAGKRPFLDGIALPFSLNKEAETASMMTLNSATTPFSGSRPTKLERPGMETFVTAIEDLPRVDTKDGDGSQAKTSS
ncbi:hypothetical protein B0I35DRAFT_452353 [Stachybotrys elegans]|uniref:Alpha/beta hydrolase fold-3 domain-containing protein n=1 Tax=Stachybotrys elegans TaxID=80388 RepID=A0A8K0SQQ2_9HYPO|nr:hypothetical protein B0I35DRAFT_452353 [Stachybotrys elegans]